MAYRLSVISVKPIYRLFKKYRLSVSVKAWTDKISVNIGYRQGQNISYRQISRPIKYRLSALTKYWLSAKTNRFAIPDNNMIFINNNGRSVASQSYVIIGCTSMYDIT